MNTETQVDMTDYINNHIRNATQRERRDQFAVAILQSLTAPLALETLQRNLAASTTQADVEQALSGCMIEAILSALDLGSMMLAMSDRLPHELSGSRVFAIQDRLTRLHEEQAALEQRFRDSRGVPSGEAP